MKLPRVVLMGVLGASPLFIHPADAGSEEVNLLSNGSIESGVDLDLPGGVPDGWSRGGSNPELSVVAFPVPAGGNHALAVDDFDPGGYADWSTELALAGVTAEGEALVLSWNEMYAVDGEEMRVTVVFYDSEDAVVGQNHFVARGFSDGWNFDPQDSTYTAREEPLVVPDGAARLTLSLVSGGPSGATGIMVIDDVCLTRPKQAVLLGGNFWPNPTFEEGTNLDQADGEVTGWSRGGSDVSIDVVTAEASVSPGHALAVVDGNSSGYGEWYADFALAGHAGAGDRLLLQWFELYQVSAGGAMRVTVLFFGGGGGVVGERHFEVTGDSPGWGGSVATSEFGRRNETVEVPAGAAVLRISVVSGGSEATTGVLVIDDLSVASPVAPEVLSGNFWGNPGFEEGAGLDLPGGVVSGWNRGGSLTSICEVEDTNAVSPSHSLAVVDGSVDDYGEWYADAGLAGHAGAGDRLNVQWFELYEIAAGGTMRVGVLFLDGGGAVVGQHQSEVSGQSGGWSGAVAGSGFTRRNVQVVVPSGAVTLRVSLVSGGGADTTGVMVIDDFSVALLSEGDLTPGNFWPNPTFELGARLDDPTRASPQGWNRGGSNATINQVTTENFVSPSHALAVIDNDPNGYGEWYHPFDLAGHVEADAELTVRWFEMYDTTGEMRLTLLFFDAGGSVLAERHFTVNGSSEGWVTDIASSAFSERVEYLFVPFGAARLQVGLVSGGGLDVTGVFVIDDLSIGVPPPVEVQVDRVTYDAAGESVVLGWPSAAGRFYTVRYSADLGDWSEAVGLGIRSGGARTTYPIDTEGRGAGFYRVFEEVR